MVLNNIEYELVDNHRDCFDLTSITEKLKDTDYFDDYDYILGDFSYDKLRLKGFYKKDNEKVKDLNNYSMIENYIKDYCSYGCRYFILKKISKTENVANENKMEKTETDKENKNSSKQKFNKNKKNK